MGSPLWGGIRITVQKVELIRAEKAGPVFTRVLRVLLELQDDGLCRKYTKPGAYNMVVMVNGNQAANSPFRVVVGPNKGKTAGIIIGVVLGFCLLLILLALFLRARHQYRIRHDLNAPTNSSGTPLL